MRYLHTLDYFDIEELLLKYVPDDYFTTPESENN